MADGIDVKINIPDFKAQLEAFGIDFERKTVRSAALAAAQVFKKRAIADAPVLSAPSKRRIIGVLKRSIYVAHSKLTTPGIERYVVSFKKSKRAGGDPFYGSFLERGWVPQGRGHKLRGGTKFKALQRKRLTEAGAQITKYRFLQPAFDQGKKPALDAFNKRIQDRIDKENQK